MRWRGMRGEGGRAGKGGGDGRECGEERLEALVLQEREEGTGEAENEGRSYYTNIYYSTTMYTTSLFATSSTCATLQHGFKTPYTDICSSRQTLSFWSMKRTTYEPSVPCISCQTDFGTQTSRCAGASVRSPPRVRRVRETAPSVARSIRSDDVVTKT